MSATKCLAWIRASEDDLRAMDADEVSWFLARSLERLGAVPTGEPEWTDDFNGVGPMWIQYGEQAS